MSWEFGIPNLSVFDKANLYNEDIEGDYLAKKKGGSRLVVKFSYTFDGTSDLESLAKLQNVKPAKLGSFVECVDNSGDYWQIRVLVGLGDISEILESQDMVTLGALVGRLIAKYSHPRCHVEGLPLTPAFIRSLLLNAHDVDKRFKGKLDESVPATETDGIALSCSGLTDEILRLGCDQARSTRIAAALTDAPHNYINSESIVPALKAMITNIQMKVLDYEAVKTRKMGAFLAVGQGSQFKPQIVHYIYSRGSPMKKFAFVGKGVSFDSGGYNIKTDRTSLSTMKMDMGGAATVFGAADLLTRQPVDDVEVHFIGMMCDNLISAESVIPGDIVTASNGTTIEILNTDAEGRLALADGLVYAAEQLGPSGGVIVDLATLTGAQIVALGQSCAAVYSNNEEWSGKFLKA